jgi:D-alanyl-D-alanine carboxypeptidase (penicillin-binding protein 5/6)
VLSLVVAAIAAALAIGYAVFALDRAVPKPALASVRVVHPFPGRRLLVAWPARGEAAAMVAGIGMIGSRRSDLPTPIASVAKVMTAYVVLTDHPLAAGEQGPKLKVTAADAAAERRDAAAGQSVLPVHAGERLTEREALEGLLLPSGNNVAALLATWDAGSPQAFVARMNATARRLGMARTHYTDPSGFAASTVSTASDQLRLARLAFRQPVFRQIVAMPQAILPGAGRQFNVDAILGQNGIVGIKTGTTSEAGGCFVFAAQVPAGRRTVTVFGAVLHQLPGESTSAMLDAVFAATRSLLTSVSPSVGSRAVVARGAQLATVTAPWSRPVALVAAHAVRALGWGGLAVVTVVPGRRLAGPIAAGQVIATATVTIASRRATVPLVAAHSLDGPSLVWRLTHP